MVNVYYIFYLVKDLYGYSTNCKGNSSLMSLIVELKGDSSPARERPPMFRRETHPPRIPRREPNINKLEVSWILFCICFRCKRQRVKFVIAALKNKLKFEHLSKRFITIKFRFDLIWSNSTRFNEEIYSTNDFTT